MIPLAIEWLWPETPIAIAIIVLIALITRTLLVRAINRIAKAANERADRQRNGALGRAERLLAQATGLTGGERQAARTITLASLLCSVADTVVASVTILMVLSTLNIDLAPLLASAGIGGIALAFGAQSLVKDYLSGIFMIIEDQYGVGDLVNLGEVTGTVEEVGLRITRVRDAAGQVWYVPNGEILRVGNQSQGWSTAYIDIPVAYDEDPTKVIAVLEGVIDEVEADPTWEADLLERPTVAGVNSITGGTMTIRMIAKCAPNTHWAIHRAILQAAMNALSAAGVRGPAVLPGTQPPAATA